MRCAGHVILIFGLAFCIASPSVAGLTDEDKLKLLGGVCFLSNAQTAELTAILNANSKKTVDLKVFKQWKESSNHFDAYETHEADMFAALDKNGDKKLTAADKMSITSCTQAMEKDMTVEPEKLVSALKKMFKSGDHDEKETLQKYLKSEQFKKDALYIKKWISTWRLGVSTLTVGEEALRACQSIQKTGVIECDSSEATKESSVYEKWAPLFKNLK